jgi:hypothetical protein
VSCQNIECNISPISTQEKFPQTKNFPKNIIEVESNHEVENNHEIENNHEVENFQLQNFFPTENLRKIFLRLSENER